MKNVLSIKDLELSVFLGWLPKEKIHAQPVWLDIDLYFAKLPKACKSDQLQDTACYAELIKEIESHLKNKRFNLIEHLAYEIYQLLKKKLAPQIKITIRISKKPSIPHLTGGVVFSCGD